MGLFGGGARKAAQAEDNDQRELAAWRAQSFDQADLLLALAPWLSDAGRGLGGDQAAAAEALRSAIERNPQAVDEIAPLVTRLLALPGAAGSGAPAAVESADGAGGDRAGEGDVGEQDRVLLSAALSSAPLIEHRAPVIAALRALDAASDGGDSHGTVYRGAAGALSDARLGIDVRQTLLQRLAEQLGESLGSLGQYLDGVPGRLGESVDGVIAAQSALGETASALGDAARSASSLEALGALVVEQTASIERQVVEQLSRFNDLRERELAAVAAQGEQLQAMESELASLRAELAEVQRQAESDHLTGLANRQALDAALERWLAGPEQWALLTWDIDHFKAVNDTHGHPVGDDVLRGVAGVLAGACDEQALAGRAGGEEFQVLLRCEHPDEALAWAESVRVRIAGLQFEGDAGAFSVSASCGLAQRVKGDNILSLTTRADKALYRAKAAGRDRCVAAPL